MRSARGDALIVAAPIVAASIPAGEPRESASHRAGTGLEGNGGGGFGGGSGGGGGRCTASTFFPGDKPTGCGPPLWELLEAPAISSHLLTSR